ncbi:O-antigen ligase family protein [Clostridium sp. MT-14]|uniref:O-antigen ligase family protein n=1 Tax=Clostridium sp. MT-14 TaxID=3348360 RepID=UPI0035F38FD8
MKNYFEYANKDYKNTLFLKLIIVSLPFNALPYFSNIFGELAQEGAFYVLVIGIIVSIIKMDKIYLPKNNSYNALIVFLALIILSFIFNYNSIFSNFTKGRSGIEKFVFQYMVLLFGFISSIYIYSIVRKTNNTLEILRKYVMISAYIVGAYCVIEILSLHNVNFAKVIVDNVSLIIRGEEDAGSNYLRLRAVCGEASFFGIYSSFVIPWMFLSINKNKKIKKFNLIFFIYYIYLIILSKSRLAYVTILVEITFIIAFTSNNFKKKLKVAIIVLMCLCCVILGKYYISSDVPIDITGVYTSLTDSDNMSNIARYGSQRAAFKMGIGHPIFGVGLGQYGFNMPNYVDDDAMQSTEILTWMDSSEQTPWAPVHGLFARIFGELGFVELFLWLYCWLYLLYKLFQKYKLNKKLKKQTTTLIALISSIIGLLLVGFDLDTFRYFGYWILLGISWNEIRETRKFNI